ncbi:MAG TPA: GNAT family protein [Polyangiaceae bacterium]|nr:GNAT family protein [Polyangiaceae bacterium]
MVLVVAEAAHLDGLDALLNDPEVARWLGGPRSREAIAATIEAERGHWVAHGFGPWVALDAEGTRVVGRGGLRRVRIGEREEIEVFYAVEPGQWRQRVGTAIARAAIGLTGSRPEIESVVAFTTWDNVASRGVIERLGFVRDGWFEHAGLPHLLYRLKSPQ